MHTPKLLAGASEGGAAVFRFDYMGRPGCLAQSPQFYKQVGVVVLLSWWWWCGWVGGWGGLPEVAPRWRLLPPVHPPGVHTPHPLYPYHSPQMAICSDLGRVFEIGPVFRAEVWCVCVCLLGGGDGRAGALVVGTWTGLGRSRGWLGLQRRGAHTWRPAHPLYCPFPPHPRLPPRTRTRTATCASSRVWTWRWPSVRATTRCSTCWTDCLYTCSRCGGGCGGCGGPLGQAGRQAGRQAGDASGGLQGLRLSRGTPCPPPPTAAHPATPRQGLNERCACELAVIGEQFPFEPLQFLPRTLRLEFAEGIAMLQAAGYDVRAWAAWGGGAAARRGRLPRRVPAAALAAPDACPPHPPPPATGGPLWRPQHRAGAGAGQAGEGRVSHGCAGGQPLVGGGACACQRPAEAAGALPPPLPPSPHPTQSCLLSSPPPAPTLTQTSTCCTATRWPSAPSTPCPARTTRATPAPLTSSSAARKSSPALRCGQALGAVGGDEMVGPAWGLAACTGGSQMPHACCRRTPLQRVHDPALLAERAVALGMAVETIQSYIDAFK